MSYLKITLKKDKKNNNGHQGIIVPENAFGATSFGHYDRIEFMPLYSWHDFRPVKYTEYATDFLEEYSIRLIRPTRHRKSDTLKKEYSFWERNFTVEDEQWIKDEESQSPFLACCLLNLSDGYTQSNTTWENYKKEVVTKLERMLSKMKQKGLHYAIYLCLGYTDVVVLLRCKELITIQNAIDEIRFISYQDAQGNSFAIVSSSYTIFGLFNRNLSEINVQEYNEKIKATFDFALKYGCSEADFWSEIRKKEREGLEIKEKYTISGSYDWRLYAQEIKSSDFKNCIVRRAFFAQMTIQHQLEI